MRYCGITTNPQAPGTEALIEPLKATPELSLTSRRKSSAFDAPPPGAGLKTATLLEPVFIISAALIEAVNCVLLTKVVVRALPFHCTIEPLMKLVPVSVKWKASLPAAAQSGVKLVSVGAGLAPCSPAVTSSVVEGSPAVRTFFPTGKPQMSAALKCESGVG
jgi:hypothetical protein